MRAKSPQTTWQAIFFVLLSSLRNSWVNGAFRNVKAQLEQFATDPLCPPQAIVPGHFLDQGHSLCGELWCGRCCSGFVFPVELEAPAMPEQQRLWLNNEERLFPGANDPGQKNQKLPIRLATGRSFHLPPENDQLLARASHFLRPVRTCLW